MSDVVSDEDENPRRKTPQLPPNPREVLHPVFPFLFLFLSFFPIPDFCPRPLLLPPKPANSRSLLLLSFDLQIKYRTRPFG